MTAGRRPHTFRWVGLDGQAAVNFQMLAITARRTDIFRWVRCDGRATRYFQMFGYDGQAAGYITIGLP